MGEKIPKPYQVVDATIQIPKEALGQKLIDIMLEKGVEDTSKCEVLTTKLAEYLIANFASYEVEYFVDQQIGS